MISFKLSQETHATFSMVVKKLLWAVYFIGLIFFAYTGLQGYQRAIEIMSNHETVDATLIFEGTSVERKKKHDVISYHFLYQFTVDDKQYSKPFSTSEDNATEYLDKKSIMIAYSRTDPSDNEILSKLKRNSDFMSWLKRFLVIIPLFGFLTFAIYILLTKKVFVVSGELKPQT